MPSFLYNELHLIECCYKALFVHPVDDYDFIVQLESDLLPRYLHNVTGSPDKLTKRGQHTHGLLNEIIRPGFDPARMLFDDLQVCSCHQQ